MNFAIVRYLIGWLMGIESLFLLLPAFLVGLVLKRITALFGVRRDKLLGLRPAVETREA